MIGLISALFFGGQSPPSPLVGDYDGSQIEMAVALSLDKDGRFRFALSYGALDEYGEGRWTETDEAVLLTSDPLTAPRFALISQAPADAGKVQIMLELPDGMDSQFFAAGIKLNSGERVTGYFSGGVWSRDIDAANPPVEVVTMMPMLWIVGDPMPIDPAKGYAFAFRFEPNDLGKVAFDNQPLRKDGAELLLGRHGRLIRFRRY